MNRTTPNKQQCAGNTNKLLIFEGSGNIQHVAALNFGMKTELTVTTSGNQETNKTRCPPFNAAVSEYS